MKQADIATVNIKITFNWCYYVLIFFPPELIADQRNQVAFMDKVS